jgi:hypothetical protein
VASNAPTGSVLFRKLDYANGPGDAASVCRLREAVGAGDQSAVRVPQRDDVPGGRRRPFVEPARRGFVQVPEDHLADLAARSPPFAACDAVFTAFLHRRHAEVIQINVGSPMFTLSGCLAGHVTGSYPMLDQFGEQRVASRGHVDRLHPLEERRVGSILQRQEMGNEAGAVFCVHA